MIKDPVSKHKLLFPSLFILGQMQHLLKWQSSISVSAWASFHIPFQRFTFHVYLIIFAYRD